MSADPLSTGPLRTAPPNVSAPSAVVHGKEGIVAIDVPSARWLAEQLSSAGHDLDGAAREARGLLLSADRPSGAPALVEDVADWTRRTATELAARIDRLVRLDTVAVDRFATGVTVAGADGARTRRLHLDVGGVTDIDELLGQLATLGILGRCPRPGSAEARRTAVAALPEVLVAGLAAQVPQLFGGADGVPFPIRDRANRRLLHWEVRRLEAKGAAAGVRERRLRRDLARWRADHGLGVIKLDAARGRVVLARGDLERAGHVAVIVPGAGLALHGISRHHLGWMDDLQAVMQRRLDAGRGGDAAVVLWLDYDSPERLVPGAVRRQAATDAARRLPAFLDGVAGVEREAVTTIGHSYGSVVLGRSLADHEGRLATDRAVALGSPGMGVQLSRELGLHDDQRLYAATFDDDPIAHLGQWHPVLGDLGRAVHGPDPRRLGAARTIELSTHDLADGDAVDRHMNYLEPGSSALGVIADLASGPAPPP